MSDSHDRARNDDVEREEPETELETEVESEVEETEVEGEPDDGEAEPSEGEKDSDGEREPDTGNRREARGRPSREHRDRRVRDEDFDRAVDRAVERRLANVRPAPAPDFAAQRRELEQRRTHELDTARLEGADKYAEVLARHNREDYQADTRFREIRDQSQRAQDRYERLCERNPIYENVRDDVYAEARRIQAAGVAVVDLETVAHALIGRRHAERAGKQGNQQRLNAERETRRQTVRASRNGSDQPAPRRRGSRSFDQMSVEEQERILERVPIRST